MGKQRILVVDDEPDVVTFIGRVLATEGFDVLSAYDGIGALDIAETERPDVILLDVMMPMMSGYEVCQQLKANPITRPIPVLCVTSAHTQETRSNAQKAGAQGVLMKPFIPAELVAQVKRQLAHVQEARDEAASGGSPGD